MKLCLQYHEQVYKYVSTLKSLLFTGDINLHILEVFQQFCAHRSWNENLSFKRNKIKFWLWDGSGLCFNNIQFNSMNIYRPSWMNIVCNYGYKWWRVLISILARIIFQVNLLVCFTYLLIFMKWSNSDCEFVIEGSGSPSLFHLIDHPMFYFLADGVPMLDIHTRKSSSSILKTSKVYFFHAKQ